MSIEGHKVPIQVYSGAGFTSAPRDKIYKLKIPVQLQDSTSAFRLYSGDVFLTDRKITVNVDYQVSLTVSENFYALLGRAWIRRLGLAFNRLIWKSQNVNQIIPNGMSIRKNCVDMIHCMSYW